MRNNSLSLSHSHSANADSASADNANIKTIIVRKWYIPKEGCIIQGLDKDKDVDDDSTTCTYPTEAATIVVDLSDTETDDWK